MITHNKNDKYNDNKSTDNIDNNNSNHSNNSNSNKHHSNCNKHVNIWVKLIRLDPEGRPVKYDVFRSYSLEVLDKNKEHTNNENALQLFVLDLNQLTK